MVIRTKKKEKKERMPTTKMSERSHLAAQCQNFAVCSKIKCRVIEDDLDLYVLAYRSHVYPFMLIKRRPGPLLGQRLRHYVLPIEVKILSSRARAEPELDEAE
ncbi:hypothetical protein EPI10_030928 [Gossypium australe]|uniref:Uncharacterized protein n=1 Tax=Gossypium australe TaxID=47621 RepID=A0A5B6X181_9ROSI|nr:hypothetical protein EPI10_030928 [Gossypium australe]